MTNSAASSGLFEPQSPHWYRVAKLRARLRDSVRIHRHVYRQMRWFVLQDQINVQHFRLGPELYSVLEALDGDTTVEQAWQAARAKFADRAPSQTEVVDLLARLHGADLLQTDVSPDANEAVQRDSRNRASRRLQRLKNPLYLRFALFDPDSMLNAFAGIARLLFSCAGFTLWLLLFGFASLLAWTHWPELKSYAGERAFETSNLVQLALVYPLVKALHELAHGLAVKRWGAEVRETGFALLLFMPVPYVDASSAWGFTDKKQRIWVGAAGILTELGLASLAMLVWLNVETGSVRDLAFNVMLIGGISTVFFNGNPLVRFDGYYVLADLLEIPNLAQRSNRYYAFLLKRYGFGLSHAQSPVCSAGEAKWFAFYGAAAFVYKIAIMVFILLLLAEQHLLAALILGGITIISQWLQPLLANFRFLLRDPSLRGHRTRACAIVVIALVSCAFALLVVPAPASNSATGVVWLPERAQIRAAQNGFVMQAVASPGELVDPGAILLRSRDLHLKTEVELLRWEREALLAEFSGAWNLDRVRAGVLEEQIARNDAQLNDARSALQALTVKSPSGGRFVAPALERAFGKFLRKGDLVGYVIREQDIVIRAVLTQDQIGSVQAAEGPIWVRLADAPATTLEARVVHRMPAASRTLPSPALSTRGGGPIPAAPAADGSLAALEPVFTIDLALVDPDSVKRLDERIGLRAYVRFEGEPEPLGFQWYRGVRQLLLRKLAI